MNPLKFILSALETHKDGWAALQDVFTVLGIVAAGFWAFYQVKRRREGFPKLKWTIEVNALPFPNNQNFLRVALLVENCGSVLLRLCDGEVWIQRVSPLGSEEAVRLSTETKRDLSWEIVAEKKLGDTIEIEPGETDTISFEFILPNTIETVLIYIHLQNKAKWTKRVLKKQGIGWNCSELFTIPDMSNKPIQSRDTRQGTQKVRPATNTSPLIQGAPKERPPTSGNGKGGK